MPAMPKTCALSALCLLALSAPLAAQVAGDGRQGPRVMGDAALNQSLHAMNDFLQRRYVHDDMMAALQGGPETQDFVAVAVAVGDVPDIAVTRPGDDFGPAISGGRSLDLHLAAFHETQAERDPLFVRIARAAGGPGLDFAEIGALPPVSGDLESFGPLVSDDLTLDAQMLALFDHILAHAERDTALNPAAPAVTGGSFDLYGRALSLF